LILAGAGSGKTRVLTTRIAWLISTGQVGPHGILAVTFTNKAAKEMTARLSSLVPINVRGMWIGTFHGCATACCGRITASRLPQTFQILDSADQLAMVKRLLKNLNIDDEKYPPRCATSSMRTRNRASAAGRPRCTTATRRSASRSTPSTRRSAIARGGGLCRIAAALLRIAAAQRTFAGALPASFPPHPGR
jgi:superfamily I DNA/RNA helicase